MKKWFVQNLTSQKFPEDESFFKLFLTQFT